MADIIDQSFDLIEWNRKRGVVVAIIGIKVMARPRCNRHMKLEVIKHVFITFFYYDEH